MTRVESLPVPPRSQHKGRRSLVELSFSDSLLPQNLDDNERETLKSRRGRKSTHVNTSETRAGENKTSGEGVQKNALGNLTEAEKEQHYNLCIKLSTENKITLKNVFNLHLIDYLPELLLQKGMPNFQMASITLQASSKIYGLRVDYLHSTALNILGNLTSKKQKGDAEKSNGLGSEGDGMHDNDADEIELRRQKTRKKKARKSYLVTNITSLDLKTLPTNQMPHKKFQKLTAILERSQKRKFFCHLPIINDECQVSLCQPYTYIQEKKPVDVLVGSSLPQDLFGLKSIVENEEPASATLENFSFFHIKWPLQADEDLCPYVETERVKKLRMAFDKITSANEDAQFDAPCDVPCDVPSPESIDFNDATAMSVGDDNAFDDLPSDEPEPIGAMDEANDMFKSPEREAASNTAGVYLPPPPSTPRMSVAELTQHLSVSCRRTTSNFPTMEMESLGMKILKAKYEHLSRKTLVMDPKKKLILKKKPKQSLYIELDEDDHGELQKSFLPGKRITLGKISCQRWSTEDTTLPQCWGFDDELKSLFNKPYEFNEEKDHLNPDCGGETPILDLDEAVGELDFNSHSMLDDSIPCMAEDDNVMDNGGDIGITLIPAPQKVKRDVISYDKIAKTIDQKQIKKAFWMVLRNRPLRDRINSNLEFSTDESTSETSDIETPFEMKFSTAYKTLKKDLPTKIIENLSVHIAFAILLQLANEHNLFIKADMNMLDAMISLEG